MRKMIAEDIHRADVWSEPSAAEITKLKADLRRPAYRLRKLFACIYERCILDAKQRLLGDTGSRAKLNTVTGFSVYFMDDEGMSSPLEDGIQDYIAAFASSRRKTDHLELVAGSKMSLPAHFQLPGIGSPSCVKFYKTWKTRSRTGCIYLSFTYAAPAVKLIIVSDELSPDPRGCL